MVADQVDFFAFTWRLTLPHPSSGVA
jgi:hypothetical protein